MIDERRNQTWISKRFSPAVDEALGLCLLCFVLLGMWWAGDHDWKTVAISIGLATILILRITFHVRRRFRQSSFTNES